LSLAHSKKSLLRQLCARPTVEPSGMLNVSDKLSGYGHCAELKRDSPGMGYHPELTQARLVCLIQTKEDLAKMVDYEARLRELCDRIVADLENCTNQDEKDASIYLALKVMVTSERVFQKSKSKKESAFLPGC